MITARWKKVLVDLWSNKVRSMLVVLSIAVGVIAVGVVASSYVLIKQDMNADYFAVNPHTARIFTDNFDDSLVADLASLPEVTSIEGRYDISVKVTGQDGKQYPVNLSSIAPIAAIKVDQLVFEQGSQVLGEHEIYLERQGAAGLGLKVGDNVDVLLKDGQTRSLKIAGTVHDVNANPFKFTSQTSGYVNGATMEWLGGSHLYNYVTFVTAGDHTGVAHIHAVAEQVAARIRQSGREVYNININRPGQHPAQSTIDTVLALMGALGVLAVFLSVFLVTNTISGLMSQQIRQIGVMKAIGATMGQMVAMYLTLVLAFGVLALVVALPLAGLVSYGFTRWLEGMLNANAAPFYIPLASLALQLFIGLFVPMVGALVPVLGGARMTVRQAMTSYGLSTPGVRSKFDRLLESVRGLPRPLLLSLRNTFRRKGRLALTLSTLILAGAIFIAVFSVRESMYVEFDHTFGYYQADVNVDFPTYVSLADLQTDIRDIPGVVSAEGWASSYANVLQADGQNSDAVVVFAPPTDTRLIEPVLTAGRWLQPSDDRAIVVDNHFVKARPDVKVGDTVQIRIAKQDYSFQVVGFFKMAGDPPNPLTYVNREALITILHQADMANSLRVVTDTHTAARQNEVLKALQARLSGLGLDGSLQTGSDLIAQKRSQTNILIYLLLFMAALIAVVGGLGLTGTMGMNVLERTREIGVMRSIGAENRAIFQLVVVEGVMIGLISWALSILLAIPIAQLLDNRVGLPLMTVPLTYVLSTQGIALWLIVVSVLSTVASLVPARSAVRLTVRDVLAYE
jgi:putative ABC transport system permease protein